MTDPAAIDLKPYKQRRAERYPNEDWPYDGPIEDSDEDIDDLIAAIEALRERATQVQKSSLDPNDFESLTQNRNSWRRVAETAQAREAELVGVLSVIERFKPSQDRDYDGDWEIHRAIAVVGVIREILAKLDALDRPAETEDAST